MYRALASVIFAGLAASASAHPSTTAIIAKPQTTTQFKRPSGVNAVKAVKAVKVSLPRNGSVAVSSKNPTPAESGRSPYGMLIATLAVMAAIAVRRQRTGRS